MGSPHHLISVNGTDYPICNRTYSRILNEVSGAKKDCDDAAELILVVSGVKKTDRYVSLSSIHQIYSWRVNIDKIILESEEIKRKLVAGSSSSVFTCVNQSEFAFDG